MNAGPGADQERATTRLERFDPGMVDGLPEPARRFFLQSIAPGTPLARSVELEMHGSIRMHPDREPLSMTATQILTPPTGSSGGHGRAAAACGSAASIGTTAGRGRCAGASGA